MSRGSGELSQGEFNVFLQTACKSTKRVLLSEAAQLIATFTHLDYNLVLKQLPMQRLVAVTDLYSQMVSAVHSMERKESTPSPRPSLPAVTFSDPISLPVVAAVIQAANSSITSQQTTTRPSGSPEVRHSNVEQWTSLQDHRLRGRQQAGSNQNTVRSPSPVPPPARSSTASSTYGLSPISSEETDTTKQQQQHQQQRKIRRQFREKGMCSFGSRCLYHHMDQNKRAKRNSSSPGTMTVISPLSSKRVPSDDDGREEEEDDEVQVHLPLKSATIAADLLQAHVAPAVKETPKTPKGTLGIMGRTAQSAITTARPSENKENQPERLPSQRRRALASLPVNHTAATTFSKGGPPKNANTAVAADATQRTTTEPFLPSKMTTSLITSRSGNACRSSCDTSATVNASVFHNMSSHEALPPQQQLFMPQETGGLCPSVYPCANMMTYASPWVSYALPTQPYSFLPPPPVFSPLGCFAPLHNEYVAAGETADTLFYHMTAEYQNGQSSHQ